MQDESMIPDEDEAALLVQRRTGERDAEDYLKAVAREQADMAEAQMRRAFRRASVQAQPLLDAIAKRTALKYVRDGQVEEADVRTSLDRGTLAARLHDAIGSLACGRAVFPDFPGREKIQEVLEMVRHPNDHAAFKSEGVVTCSEHGDHDAVLRFRGLELREVDDDACACIGGSHRFENTSSAVLNFGGWRVPPAETFDLPDGGEATVGSFLASGLVKDLTA
ncbi:MAG: hypothetical protein V3U33_06410, partial [candidate division NC10 bacterium]